MKRRWKSEDADRHWRRRQGNEHHGTVVFPVHTDVSDQCISKNCIGEGEGVGGDPRGAEAPHPGRCGFGHSWTSWKSLSKFIFLPF